MEDRETARMHKYGESKTTRIMMATVPHVTSGLRLRKFQADGFLLTRVYKCNTGEPSRRNFCSGQVISITYSVCVCSLAIQHAKRMRRVKLSCGACPILPYFSTLSRKRHDFRKNVNEHKMRVLILSETFLILSRNRDIIITVHRASCKVPVILVRL